MRALRNSRAYLSLSTRGASLLLIPRFNLIFGTFAYSLYIISLSSSDTISRVNSSWFLRNKPHEHFSGTGSVLDIIFSTGKASSFARAINILGISGKLKFIWNSSSFPKYFFASSGH